MALITVPLLLRCPSFCHNLRFRLYHMSNPRICAAAGRTYISGSRLQLLKIAKISSPLSRSIKFGSLRGSEISHAKAVHANQR